MPTCYKDDSTKRTARSSGASSWLESYRSEDLIDVLEFEASGYHQDGEEEEEGSHSGTLTSSEELKQQSLNVEKTTKRTQIVAFLVVLVGAAASVGFQYLGISAAKAESRDTFERLSSDMAKEIDGARKDYEEHALWVHESCRNWRTDNYTQQDFSVLYNYIISGGLDVYMVEWVPNVSNAERPALEEEAYKYWSNVEGVNYTDIKGYEPDPEHPGEIMKASRSEQPFYFPIQFGEPREAMQGVVHFDVYSIPGEVDTIRHSMKTWKPSLTHRIVLLEHTQADGYSVVLFHPGTPLPGKFDVDGPNDFACMVIHIKALLTRAARSMSSSMKVYLYDKTITSIDGAAPEFLSAIQIQSATKDQKKQVDAIPEVEFVSLKDSSLYYFEQDITMGGRTWVMVSVPVNGTYEPDLTFVVTTGVMLFLASVLLAVWMLHNMHKSIEMHRVISKAAAEASIVSNLFPASVRERMIQDAEAKNKVRVKAQKKDVFVNDGNGGKRTILSENRLNNLLTSEGIFGSKPIAELYPYTTVMVCDLIGFTAWASVREPSQVFTLLEIIYHSFDSIARRRRVYKVETVGDSYVAVAGLPHARKDHAVVMARFATDCVYRLQKLVKALEKTLGPDTGDIGGRFGLHSGQVIAGVLRGDKGRFQLFGSVINLASRMESTGIRNKVHISQETADLLVEHGHGKWVIPREGLVEVKGLGKVQTYFVNVINGSKTSSVAEEIKQDFSDSINSDAMKDTSSKTERLVEWNVEVLSSLLRKIVARRGAMNPTREQVSSSILPSSVNGEGATVLDEVAEIIVLPEFNAKAIQKQVDPDSIELEADIVAQLESLVTRFASLYRNNPFHNFEHASHVTMSVIKMMGRIVDPKEIAAKKKKRKKSIDYNEEKLEAELHDHTLGITSDPLTQFACVFSALIHDLDHTGLSNAILIKRKSPLAAKYGNKSVAEQNSVDLAWELLMSSDYDKLRACICCNQEEFTRFRSLVVNSVMATDIMDKELGAARKARWNTAFQQGDTWSDQEETEQLKVNRKATIVIEHLIQASDISHTMQHWHVYAKWNERLFQEMYKAYKTGKLDTDPSVGWYQGEIGFFDFYIIPLAKKLFTCGVFGVSSDEFLNYALINRKEWEQKGEQMVEQYLTNYAEKYERSKNATEECIC